MTLLHDLRLIRRPVAAFAAIGVCWGAFTAREPERNQRNIEELFDLWKAGKINPLVSETYPIERAHEAIAKLENRGAIGKLVVTME